MRVLTSWENLQALNNVTTEGADLDFKGALQLNKAGAGIELAKDVAALANVLGGHILVGVSTDLGGTRCTGFHGIDADSAGKVTRAFEEAVRDRCRPTPVFATRLTSVSGSSKTVVVVAVEASPIAPIGVSINQTFPPGTDAKLVEKAWVFPYRVASQTLYLQPDQFGAYDSMSARRAAAVLQGIPENQRFTVTLRWTGRSQGGRDFEARPLDVRLQQVDLRENVSLFVATENVGPVISIPLDEISTVWRSGDNTGKWIVGLLGQLNNGGTTRWD
jgi:hypothetical protein